MKQNKLSVWAIIILVVTIISAILLVFSIVSTAIAMPTVMAAAKQAAEAEGAGEEAVRQAAAGEDEAAIQLAINIAIGAVIAAVVISSIFSILQIIGGFLFSLKGKWGVFCIVVAILGLAAAIFDLVNDITKKSGAMAISVSSITIAVNALMVVACFKHKQELN